MSYDCKTGDAFINQGDQGITRWLKSKIGCDNVDFFFHAYNKGAIIQSLHPNHWWRHEDEVCHKELEELKHDRTLNLDAIRLLEYNQERLAKYQMTLKKEIAWMKSEVAN